MDRNIIQSDFYSVSEEEYYATINLRQNEQTFKERQNGEIKFSFTNWKKASSNNLRIEKFFKAFSESFSLPSTVC